MSACYLIVSVREVVQGCVAFNAFRRILYNKCHHCHHHRAAVRIAVQELEEMHLS